MRPETSLKPLWWFLFLFLVPPLGYILLIVNLLVHTRTPEAITGRCDRRLNVRSADGRWSAVDGIRWSASSPI